MYAVDFRNMRTAIHGLFVGKGMRRMRRFYDRLNVIFCDNDISSDEQHMAYEELLKEFPDVEIVEEVDFKRFRFNEKGIKGVDLDGKWCRIVNLVPVDIWCV